MKRHLSLTVSHRFIKIFFPVICILSFAATGFAQTPKPTSSPTESVDANEDVVKISTNLIQIDVTVTDKNGKIITDLKPEDFEIYENGKKQIVTNFSYVSKEVNQNVKTLAKSDGESKINNPIQVSGFSTKQPSRTIALVVDDLSISFDNFSYVRKALRKFVEEQMQPNDLVAIIRTGGGSGFLQQFTYDKRLLLAAVEALRWNPAGQGKISSFEALSSKPQEEFADPEKKEQVRTEKEFLAGKSESAARNQDFRQGIYSTGTLGTLNSIISGMNELPGRKSVMLLSEGFKIFNRTVWGKERDSKISAVLNKLVDAANRASVVVYTMDVRGVQTLELNAADNATGRSARELLAEASQRGENFSDSQDGLIYLAKQTGGAAIINNNNFNNGLQKMLDNQSGYYLIGYQPDSETFDPELNRFNKLVIKVGRKDADVRYRSGFFAIADNKNTREINPKMPTAAQQIVKAITSPFNASGINLRLTTIFGYEKNLGSYIQSLLYINPQDLKFSDEPNKEKKVSFDVLAASFGENGAVVDQISKNYTLTLSNEDYQKIIRSGFVYNLTFPVKNPGAYQMRTAIRDATTGKIGSAGEFLEVPDLKKGRLSISGLILENFTPQQWQNFNQNNQIPVTGLQTNPLVDTSLRRFKRGTVLRYGFEIYNAKLGQNQKANLNVQRKLFHDGKLVFASENQPVELAEQIDVQKINSTDSINLKADMPAGEYILQIIVTDNLAKGNNKMVSQSVQIEITDF